MCFRPSKFCLILQEKNAYIWKGFAKMEVVKNKFGQAAMKVSMFMLINAQFHVLPNLFD